MIGTVRNKEERGKLARERVAKLEKTYEKEIVQSVENTKLYNKELNNTAKVKELRNKNLTSFELLATDTVSALIEATTNKDVAIKKSEKVTILNFASYKHPGGGYLSGSKAQEECLCAESNLYNILSKFNNTIDENITNIEEYKNNKSYYYGYNTSKYHKYKGNLYTNRGLYTPDVLFITSPLRKPITADVITVAAPNYSASRKYVSAQENSRELESRIKFVLSILAENNTDTIILGAFGCGVFGQEPVEVAEITLKLLTTDFKGVFNRVIFAIPDKSSKNYRWFSEVLNIR